MVGCASSALAKLVPSRTCSRTCVSARLSCSFSICSMSAFSDSKSGMPAPTRVASWRVSTATSEMDGRPMNSKSLMFRLALASAALPSVATVSRTPSFRSAVRRALAFSASRTPFTCLPVPTRIPRYSKTATIPPLTVDDHVFLRRRQDFFDRGEAPEHLARTVVAHRVHALRDRGPLDRLRVRALQDEGAHGVVDDEELVDAAPAHEPLLHALVAAARLVEDRLGAHLLAHELVVEVVDGVLRRDRAAALPREAIGVEAELTELVVRGRVGHLAVLAEHADEALGEDADDAGAHQEGLDLHLDE